MPQRRQHLHVSIPCGLPLAVAALVSERKAVGVFLCLKGVTSSGVIKRYRYYAGTLSASFGFGKSKYFRYIDQLIALGFIERVNKKDLRLVSIKKVALHYGLHPDHINAAWHPKTYKLAINELTNAEDILKAAALQENLSKQDYALIEKLTRRYLLSRTSTPDLLTPQARKRLLKGFDPLLALREFQSLWSQDFGTHAHQSDINPMVTLARIGIATVFGRKSAMTGTRTIRKLLRAGLVTDTAVRHRLAKCSYADFVSGQRCGAYDRSHYYWDGCVWKRMPNQITVSAFHQAIVLPQK